MKTTKLLFNKSHISTDVLLKKVLSNKKSKKSQYNNFGGNFSNILNKYQLKKFGGKKDKDFDGIKNKFDCNPLSSMRQDFSPFKWKDSSQMTAARRFGGQKNLNKLKRLGSGRDRTVYELDKDKVIKIAKNPGGLTQNTSEKDIDYLGMGKHYETGLDYAVMQKSQPLSLKNKRHLAAIRKDVATVPTRYNNRQGYLADVKGHLSRDNSPLYKSGIGGDIFDFSFEPQELFANRQWGENKEGDLVLNDGGALQDDSSLKKYRVKDFGQKNWQLKEWQEVQRQRQQFKNKGSDKKHYQKHNINYNNLANLNSFEKENKKIKIPLNTAWEMRRKQSNIGSMESKREPYTMERIGDAIDKKSIDTIEVDYKDYKKGVLTDGKHRLIVYKDKGFKDVEIQVNNIPKGASLQKQDEWANKSGPQRDVIRKSQPDTDGDRIPDKYDCEPDNVMAQDSQIYLSPTKSKNFFYNVPNKPKKIYIGKAGMFKPDTDEDINYLSNTIAHEEMHQILHKEEGMEAMSALDSITPFAVLDKNKNIINKKMVGLPLGYKKSKDNVLFYKNLSTPKSEHLINKQKVDDKYNVFSKRSERFASIDKQNEWAAMEAEQRAEERLLKLDTDGDRIPDEYDCEPDNVMRQHLMQQHPHFKDKHKIFTTPDNINIHYKTSSRAPMSDFMTPDDIGYELDNLPYGVVSEGVDIWNVPRSAKGGSFKQSKKTSQHVGGHYAKKTVDDYGDEIKPEIRLYPYSNKTINRQKINKTTKQYKKLNPNVNIKLIKQVVKDSINKEPKTSDKHIADDRKHFLHHEIGHSLALSDKESYDGYDDNKYIDNRKLIEVKGHIPSQYQFDHDVKDKNHPTKYAKKNSKEDFAESYTIWQNKHPSITSDKLTPDRQEFFNKYYDTYNPKFNTKTTRQVVEDTISPQTLIKNINKHVFSGRDFLTEANEKQHKPADLSGAVIDKQNEDMNQKITPLGKKHIETRQQIIDSGVKHGMSHMGTGASIQKQDEWKNMSGKDRDIIRSQLKDSDGDRIPDEFDCEPDNVMAQDTIYSVRAFHELNPNKETIIASDAYKIMRGRDTGWYGTGAYGFDTKEKAEQEAKTRNKYVREFKITTPLKLTNYDSDIFHDASKKLFYADSDDELESSAAILQLYTGKKFTPDKLRQIKEQAKQQNINPINLVVQQAGYDGVIPGSDYQNWTYGSVKFFDEKIPRDTRELTVEEKQTKTLSNIKHQRNKQRVNNLKRDRELEKYGVILQKPYPVTGTIIGRNEDGTDIVTEYNEEEKIKAAKEFYRDDYEKAQQWEAAMSTFK